MREKIEALESSEDGYGLSSLSEKHTGKRLDLNDLLNRAKLQKKKENKNNILIFSIALSVLGIVVLIISF